MVASAPQLMTLHLVDVQTGKRQSNKGAIEIRQRGAPCLALNSHEPRPFIVCWNNGIGHTDISLHRTVGGEHGALHAARLMYERYSQEKA